METSKPLVRPDWTNAPIESILFNQLILLHRTIINRKNEKEKGEELVRSLWTIISDEVSREIALTIHENVVFTVRSLHKGKSASKTAAYEVVNKLIDYGIVEDTIYKAENPPNGRAKYHGPKSTFYKLRGYEIEDVNRDPYLRNAQHLHNLTFNESAQALYDKSVQGELNNISAVVTDYYKGRHLYGFNAPKPVNISEHIAANYPDLEIELRGKLVQKIYNKLCSTKEASP